MRVAIRTDASAAIGTGHVRRMLSLAKAVRDQGAEVRFVTRALGFDSVGLIAREGFEGTALLPTPGGMFTPDPDVPHSAWAEVSTERDLEETKETLSAFTPDWMVVDHYAFDAKWHEGVRNELQCRVAVIDDLSDRALNANLLVDHNYHPDHVAKFVGRINSDARILAGPRYAMVDQLYADAPRYEFDNAVRSIGVFLGGVDAGGFTFDALDALEDAGWSGPIEVVSTHANPALGQLRERMEATPAASLLTDLPNLADFFARHDIQIGAGGGAIWERCCIGPPTIGLACAANQEMSVPFADAAGFMLGIADFHNRPDRRAALADAITQLVEAPDRRRALHDAAVKLVDGRGTSRIAAAMLDAR